MIFAHSPGGSSESRAAAHSSVMLIAFDGRPHGSDREGLVGLVGVAGERPHLRPLAGDDLADDLDRIGVPGLLLARSRK